MTAPTKAEVKLSKELQDIAKKLEVTLEKRAGKKMLFSLLIFNEEEGSSMQYISNTDRESIIDALKSLLIGWDEGVADIPAHEVT